jgi:inner membrane protein
MTEVNIPGDTPTNKLLYKGLIIAFIVVLLMIPAWFVQGIIKEREDRQQEAVAEVRGKWADTQTVTGPVLIVPFNYKKIDVLGKYELVRDIAFFLPDKLDITSSMVPEKKHRGIYDVMLYSASIHMAGDFSPLPLGKLKLDPAEMRWDEAYVCMNITDARGLKQSILLNWNNTSNELNPGAPDNSIFVNPFSTPVAIDTVNLDKPIHFSTDIKLKGSRQLFFSPIGKQTSVKMNSAWTSPSFVGSQLPDTSMIGRDGFEASWQSLSHSRSFPQQWKTATYDLEQSAFGTGLFIEVSGYQKTMRSVKYAILCILLTFTAFFLIETQNSKSIHPVQYALVGFALILFYILLLSFSEYTGFNIAYVIASVATIGLIMWFVRSLLGSFKLSALLSVVLMLLYSYVFTILQLQDYALLMGSVGLFLTLATVMYFSKKFKW